MARGKGDIKGWITKNGVHIPIYGQYTVRGGVEPKAKGSKFRGSKKKFDHSKRPDTWIDKKDKVTRKQFEENVESYPVGTYVKMNAGGNMNGFGSNMNYVKTGDDEWTAYSDIGGYSDTKRTTADLVKNLDKKKIKNIAVKDDLVDKGTSKEDKYKDRDWNKDVDDAKRYGYSEQTEEGKKPVTKAEEEKQARQSFRDKKAQEQGFADDASMRSYNEETGVNEETWKSQTEEEKKPSGQHLANVKKGDFKGYDREAKIEQQINDRFKTKKEWDEIAKNAGYKDSNDPEFQKNADDIVAKNKQANSNTAYDYNGQTITHHPNGVKPAFHGNEEYNYEVHPAKGEKGANQYFKTEQEAQDYINGRNTKSQASSTPDMRDETKTLGDGGKVTSRIKAQEQAYVDNAFKPQVSEKERKMQELRDAERAYVNEAFKGNTKQASSKSSIEDNIEDKIAQGLRKQGVPESAVAKEAFNLKKGFAEGSIAPEELKSLGVTSDEMRLLQSNEKISAMSRYASGKDKTTFIDPMGNLMQKRNRSAIEKNTGMNFAKDIGKGNIQDAIDREKAERAKVYDRVKGNAEGTTKSPMVVRDMTPSGLRSAWETATGSEKTKISSELRRRGYSYVGGKWVKGNKS